jgi:predicted Rdx family selenoprotein
MKVLFSPYQLIQRASKIKGYTDLLESVELKPTTGYMVDTAIQVTDEISSEWDSDCGFGSSDMTYCVKQYIDDVIYQIGKSSEYKTDFKPYLSVIKK